MLDVFLGHIDSIWSSEVNSMYLSKFIGMLLINLFNKVSTVSYKMGFMSSHEVGE